MIKPIDKYLDKKEGNIFEFSIIGLFELNTRSELKIQIEEISENICYQYAYDVTTYFLKSHQGYQNVTNLIEFHHNKTENYKENEYKIDNDEFYNRINFMEKIDEYLIISKYYLKYSTPAFINFALGSSNIIEISRCEENMELVLASIGYKEKSITKKKGFLFKFKNYPILILLIGIDTYNIPSESTLEDKNPSAQQPTKPDLSEPNLIEITGYCFENEKEYLMKTLEYIKEKLNSFCKFDSDINK
jgi:hypothetical protein